MIETQNVSNNSWPSMATTVLLVGLLMVLGCSQPSDTNQGEAKESISKDINTLPQTNTDDPTNSAKEKKEVATTKPEMEPKQVEQPTKEPEEAVQKSNVDQKAGGIPVAESSKWVSLFNGNDLTDWTITDFGGQGEVYVEDGQLFLEQGIALTGVHTDRSLPKTNYEVELKAMRVLGSDFFCGLTFPVGEDFCSLIVGGWGGGVCGLSSLDGLDASENETLQYIQLVKEKWYDIRLKVVPGRIQVWLDGKTLIDQDVTDRKISVRQEVELSRPFGIASWQTTAAIKDFRIREISAE